ncbi:MAG: cytidine deaminase [Verrucomicrobiales bacterium]|nr:cytidine deaminase [Verrucomicrobiales bacterium]
MNNPTNIVAEAMKAREFAQAPYSKFKVGAALLTDAGAVVHGANVESASYGLSCCAERVAIFKALTSGHFSFNKLAIASEGGASPCGACRQIIAEYAAKAELILVDINRPESPSHTNIQTLLPNSFTGKNLPSN